jgi:hypothetical protein
MASSQALLRIGESLDMYYTDDGNCRKQSIPVEYDTRYSQDFSNKSSGVSVLVIPPNQGVRHCLIVLGYNAASINTQTGSRALERGWGYKAISQISFRIGGSSQYFLTGAQLLARNLRLCRTQTQRDAILSLGGSECKVAADFDVDQYAYIPVSVWCAPGEDELQIPLPTDLLSQQVQVTAQLVGNSFWSGPIAGFAGGDVVPPSAFDTAYFQIEQLCMRDRGMGLANRVDMNTHMYSMPLPTFDQQEVLLQLSAAPVQPVVLTGFRAGEVKKLQIYLTRNDAAGANSAADNALRWYAPDAVKVLYAGLVYSQYLNGSSRMWNLLDGTAPSAVNQSALAIAGGVWTSTPVLSEWAELPFGQPSGSDYEADILVHGKEITNGIVNLEVTPPQGVAAPSGWTLHIVYVYNSTLVFSRGTAELTF